MMPWLIDLQDRNVVIIGGGNVASRKVRQFLGEGAKVKVIALKINDEIKTLNIEYDQVSYQPCHLSGAFLVYAATDDSKLNSQIVSEANKLGILSASATPSQASLKGMKTLETDKLLLGISTKGSYPAFTKKLSQELVKYDDYLTILGKIRNQILLENLVSQEQRKQFFNQLMMFEQNDLDQILKFIQKKAGYLLIFTTSQSKVIEAFTKKVDALYVSLKDENYQIKLNTLTYLQINWHIQPMVISYGQIFDKILSILSPLQLEEPLFIDDELLSKIYLDDWRRLFIIHPRSDDKLAKVLSKYGKVQSFDSEIIGEYDQIVPFILTSGYHYHHDVLRVLKGSKTRVNPVLLEDQRIIEILVNEIKNRFENEKIAI